MKKQFLRWAMDKYKTRKQAKHDASLPNVLATVRTLLDKAKYGFFISHGADGWCSTRYVQPICEWNGDELCIWVGTSASSRKIAEVRANNKITMAFGNDPAGANLMVYGTAEISRDPELCRKYWKPEWRLFFPEGPKSDDLIVVAIKPERIELMDLKRNIIPEPFGLVGLEVRVKEGIWAVT